MAGVFLIATSLLVRVYTVLDEEDGLGVIFFVDGWIDGLATSLLP